MFIIAREVQSFLVLGNREVTGYRLQGTGNRLQGTGNREVTGYRLQGINWYVLH
jgi:hypothetical protein